MAEGWLNHVALMLRARGVSPALLLWSMVVAAALLVTLVFLTIAADLWLAERYDALTAALALAGVYLFVAATAALALALQRRRAMQRAQRELAARKAQAWLDPRLIAVGLELGRSLGWRRGLPLAAVGLIAAGIAREWSAHRPTGDEPH